MVRKLGAIVAVSAVLGAAMGLSATASAGNPCTTRGTSPHVFVGDDTQNECNGHDDFDSFYGYAMGDTFGGLGGQDKFRGAHGNDTMTDGQGSGDNDRSCDGDGLDFVQFQDGDVVDVGHFVNGDGEQDGYQSNPDDQVNFYDASNGCPLSDD